MQFFIVFVIGAIIIGAGSMLSPAWPTRQPRIALAATLCLALIVGGAVFWAELFGWDTLVIDYLLFAIVSGVVLGGTLSTAQARAEARGEELLDEEQGWPGPKDLTFFGLVALLVLVPLWIFLVPPGESGQSIGYLTFTAEASASFETLAPYHPEIQIFHAPGFHGITAYLTKQLDQPIPGIQFALAAVVIMVTIWLVYDLGGEMLDKRLGRAMAIVSILALGLLSLYVGAQFTLLMGVLFAFASILYALRYFRYRYPIDMIGAGLMLGATLYSSGTVFALLAGAYLIWLLLMWLVPTADEYDPAPDYRRWLGLALGVPFVAFLGTAPWLLNNLGFVGLLPPDAAVRSFDNLWLMLGWHGLWIAPLAAWGFVLAMRGTVSGSRQIALMSLALMLMSFDLGVTGIVPMLLGSLGATINAEHAAWAGPIIPYTVLGGIGLLWLWDRLQEQQKSLIAQRVPVLMSVLIIVIAILPLLRSAMLDIVHNAAPQLRVELDQDALAAMRWIAQFGDQDALVLNLPDDDWAASIVEREVIYLPPLPAVVGGEEALARLGDRQDNMATFWENPGTAEDLLREAGITYVLNWGENLQDLSTVDYLELLFEQGDAIVYRLRETEAS